MARSVLPAQLRSRRLAKSLVPVRALHQRTRRRGNAGPHALRQGVGDRVQVIVLGERIVGLFEVECPVGHLGDHTARWRANDPAALPPVPARSRPATGTACRLAGPNRPNPNRARANPLPNSIGVDTESIEHIVIHDGQLLLDVVDAQASFSPGPNDLAASHTRSRRCPMNDARRDRSALGRALHGGVR